MKSKKSTNYREKYSLGRKNVRFGSKDLGAAVKRVMKRSTKLGRYRVRGKKDGDFVIFGRNPQFAIPMYSPDALLLSESLGWFVSNPLTVLRYGVYPRRILIGYTQTPSGVTPEDYFDMRSYLGERPHELLFAHFLDRLSPVLDRFPDTEVLFAPTYLHKPVYPFLRDRFLDKHYFLNPGKERVQQILGENNSWLSAESVRERPPSRVMRDNFSKYQFWQIQV